MSRFELVDTAPTPERAILVGVDWRSDGWPIERSLDELERLAGRWHRSPTDATTRPTRTEILYRVWQS